MVDKAVPWFKCIPLLLYFPFNQNMRRSNTLETWSETGSSQLLIPSLKCSLSASLQNVLTERGSKYQSSKYQHFKIPKYKYAHFLGNIYLSQIAQRRQGLTLATVKVCSRFIFSSETWVIFFSGDVSAVPGRTTLQFTPPRQNCDFCQFSWMKVNNWYLCLLVLLESTATIHSTKKIYIANISPVSNT